MVVVWSRRLPETLPPERRRASGLAELAQNAGLVARNRITVGYGLAATFLFGSMAAYLGNSEVLIDEVFGRGSQFALIFGLLALSMGAATLLNARLVVALGLPVLLRRVSALLVAATGLFLTMALVTDGRPPFALFCVAMLVLLPLHTTLLPNCNTAAMGPAGKAAGTAAALLGTVSTAGGAILGSRVDAAYDGTLRPLAASMFVFSLFAAGLVRFAGAASRADVAQPAAASLPG